jgi:F-type H+/Na+-transporting ATPase subunit alpha
MQKGYYDGLELRRVNSAAVALREFFATRKDALLTKIRNKAALDAELEAEIKTAVDEWKATFAA